MLLVTHLLQLAGRLATLERLLDLLLEEPHVVDNLLDDDVLTKPVPMLVRGLNHRDRPEPETLL